MGYMYIVNNELPDRRKFNCVTCQLAILKCTALQYYTIVLTRSLIRLFLLGFNRHVESIEEPRYAPLDQQGHVMGPRVLPVGPPTNNGPRRGPLDPSVPYALLQKKNKPKKPRQEPHEPAIGK